MRRSPLAFALLLIPSLAVAGPLEDAHRLTEEARHNLQTIDQALAAAQIAGRRAVQDLEAAQARQRALPAQINATNRTIANLQGQLDAAAKLLPALRAQSDAANNAAGAKQAALTLAQKRVEIAQTAAKDAQRKLQKELESRPEFQEAVARQSRAQAQYDNATRARLDLLAQTPEYKSAQTAVVTNEAQLTTLRAAGAETAKLTQAADDAMKARFTVETLKQNACAADPDVVAARTELQTAGADVIAMKNAVGKDAATHPKLGPLFKTLAELQTALAATQKEFQTARAAATKADGQLKDVQNDDANARAGIQAAQAKLAALTKALDDALIDIRDAEQRVNAAQVNCTRLQQLRDQAARLLDQRQQDENRLRKKR